MGVESTRVAGHAAVCATRPPTRARGASHPLSTPPRNAPPPPHAQVAKAQTRRRKDKDMIDAFILESIGFEAVDAALTKFTLENALATRERALTTMRVIRLRDTDLDAADFLLFLKGLLL